MKKLLIILLILIPAVCVAESWELTWDPVEFYADGDPNVTTGYNVYYGIGSLTDKVDAGNVTNYVKTDCDPDKVYYFVVKSYIRGPGFDIESLPSNMVKSRKRPDKPHIHIRVYEAISKAIGRLFGGNG